MLDILKKIKKRIEKMKKILSIALISTLSLVLSTGCSSKEDVKPAQTAKPKHVDAKVSEDALFVHEKNNKKVLHDIKKAGEKTGWHITDFKTNEVIAEKTTNENTVSSSVVFSDGHIEFSNPEATQDLRDAIEKECNANTDTSEH
jgi:predicted nucleic acid-binding Zn ribbon protein